MINQIGSLSFGHYTAKAFNEEADSWFDFNDTTVTKMTIDIEDKTSEEYCKAVADKVVTERAYVLFYKKRGIDD